MGKPTNQRRWSREVDDGFRPLFHSADRRNVDANRGEYNVFMNRIAKKTEKGFRGTGFPLTNRQKGNILYMDQIGNVSEEP